MSNHQLTVDKAEVAEIFLKAKNEWEKVSSSSLLEEIIDREAEQTLQAFSAVLKGTDKRIPI